jgi:hypothetical protein
MYNINICEKWCFTHDGCVIYPPLFLGKTFQNQNDTLIMVYWVAQQVGSKPILMFKDLDHCTFKLKVNLANINLHLYWCSSWKFWYKKLYFMPTSPQHNQSICNGGKSFSTQIQFWYINTNIILFVLFSRKAYDLHLEWCFLGKGIEILGPSIIPLPKHHIHAHLGHKLLKRVCILPLSL